MSGTGRADGAGVGFAARLRAQLEELERGVSAEFPATDWSPMLLFGQLAALANLQRAFYERILTDLGLTRAEQVVLGILRGGTADAPVALARITQQTAPGMTRTLDRLEARGFVARRAHRTDRRMLRVVLTDAGRQVAEEMLRHEIAAQHALLDGLDPVQRAEIGRAVEVLIERFTPRGEAVAVDAA